jgi:hypothetical protein
VTINVKCECGREHSADEAMAGRTFTCDACGRVVKVPAAGGPAGDLVTQMRAVQDERSAVARGASAFAEASAAARGAMADKSADKMADRAPGAPADAGSASSAMPKAKPAPARAKRARPKDARERAAYHLGVKKVLWLPALAVGALCSALALVCLVVGPVKLLTMPSLTSGEGKWGPVFVDEPFKGVEEKWELVQGSDGRWWFIATDAETLEWENGRPKPTQGGWDLPVRLAQQSAKFSRLSAAAEARASAGKRYLLFGPIFLVIGPVLLFLSLWMRRDIRLVAEAEKAETAETAEQVEKAEKTTESA